MQRPWALRAPLKARDREYFDRRSPRAGGVSGGGTLDYARVSDRPDTTGRVTMSLHLPDTGGIYIIQAYATIGHRDEWDLSARYHRIARRRGQPKTMMALAHSLIICISASITSCTTTAPTLTLALITSTSLTPSAPSTSNNSATPSPSPQNRPPANPGAGDFRENHQT
ncbi:MAG: hypothetical protein M1118_00790 [Chloroflexi bacterium]|nr:hypothetical protein [Chloroflexota bacterium]